MRCSPMDSWDNPTDPGAEPDVQQGVNFLARTLREARDTGNPFLSSPSDLEEAGFVGVPYILTT
jgi:hypothetical protein